MTIFLVNQKWTLDTNSCSYRKNAPSLLVYCSTSKVTISSQLQDFIPVTASTVTNIRSWSAAQKAAEFSSSLPTQCTVTRGTRGVYRITSWIIFLFSIKYSFSDRLRKISIRSICNKDIYEYTLDGDERKNEWKWNIVPGVISHISPGLS